MTREDVESRLREELASRGLDLLWVSDLNRLGPRDLVVFGAEQASASGDSEGRLVAGFGPGGFGESFGNSPIPVLQSYHDRFLKALEIVGIPRASLHSNFFEVGRGKIWPTFVARLTQKAFRELRPLVQAA